MKMQHLLFALLTALLPLAGMAQDGDAAPTTELQGKVTTHNGKTVVLSCDPGNMPSPGDSVDVYKYFERTVLNGTMTGWLNVGMAKVTAARGTQVTLTLLLERSEIIMNGSKVDHFKVSNRMKLSWPIDREALREELAPKGTEKVDTDE